jgi:hypothetical protein
MSVPAIVCAIYSTFQQLLLPLGVQACGGRCEAGNAALPATDALLVQLGPGFTLCMALCGCKWQARWDAGRSKRESTAHVTLTPRAGLAAATAP